MVIGRVADALLRWLMGKAPGKRHVPHFSSEKASEGEGDLSPECPVALVGNLEGLKNLSTAPTVIIQCSVFHETLHHHAQCNI